MNKENLPATCDTLLMLLRGSSEGMNRNTSTEA